MIATSIEMAFVALTTLATVVMIGMGFLPHPSRATATWSLAFVLAMLSSYAASAAETLLPAHMRALGSGMLLAAIGFIWSGLRLHRGARRSGSLLAAAHLVLVPLSLLLTAGTDAYAPVFRIDFAIASVFAVLIVVELVRLGPRQDDALLPLLLSSALFPAFAVFALIEGAVRLASGEGVGGDLDAVRAVNGIGGIVYIVCALLTLLLVARGRPASSARGSSDFEAVARDRLRRAERAGDAWWSLIDVSLDDPDAVRSVFGSTRYAAITERFATTVLSVLPPDADIDRIDATRVVALLPRSPEAVRQILIRLIEAVADSSPESQFSVRVSASIGWAQVGPVGYDLDALRTAAGQALDLARTDGGGRWERTSTPCAAADDG